MTTDTTAGAQHPPHSISGQRPGLAAALGTVKGSASDQVFRGIVRGLEMQHFVPGQRLVEADLAARFGVGRNSVREAIQRLAAEGIVDLSRHKGASIRVLSWSEAMDLLDIVERILSLLTRTAARGHDRSDLATDLREAMAELEIADEQRDKEAFFCGRRRFYRTLLEMGGNRDLKRLFTIIHIPIFHAQQRLPILQKFRMTDYRAIVSTVLSGDAEAAEAAGADHVKNVRQALLAAKNKRQDTWL